MKCFACGYEYDSENPEEYIFETTLGNGVKMKTIILQRGKPFIRIGPATLMDDTVYGAGGYTHIPLYACPNCGTVRMDNGC